MALIAPLGKTRGRRWSDRLYGRRSDDKSPASSAPVPPRGRRVSDAAPPTSAPAAGAARQRFTDCHGDSSAYRRSIAATAHRACRPLPAAVAMLNPRCHCRPCRSTERARRGMRREDSALQLDIAARGMEDRGVLIACLPTAEIHMSDQPQRASKRAGPVAGRPGRLGAMLLGRPVAVLAAERSGTRI